MTTPAVVLVSTLVEKDGKFLMVQEGKDSHDARGKWNFPAGRVEFGESLPEAAIRETKEETGYDIKVDNVLSILKTDFDGKLAVVFFFKGSILNEEPDEREKNIIDVRFVSHDEINGLDLRFSDIVDIARIARSGTAYPLDIIKGEKNEL
ncbi:MAG: NUDIX domain-containing protein [Candidatus Nomurabacteria bacterium]|nr:NUDIX domain-containing protein [Candidatus Nomurabacteria bacterium]